MNVPFNNLYAQYLSLKAEIDEAIARTIEASAFVRGPEVELFEENFASLMGVKHCVSCANGTDALYIAMHSLGVKLGDEIIVPAILGFQHLKRSPRLAAKLFFVIHAILTSLLTWAIEAKISDELLALFQCICMVTLHRWMR